jgi:SAM-dependent methyltransferase
MHSLTTDPTYLTYQYADSEKLRIRQEAHRLYSENPADFLAWVVDLLDPQPGERVADVGCGPGIYHPLLARRGAVVVGLDASLGMAGDVAEQAGQKGLRVWPVQAGAEALPLATASVDRLMANHMLYHVPDQLAALQEMRRVLKPGGRAVLTTNAADHNQRLFDLHGEVARSLGYTPQTSGNLSDRFTLEHGELVRQVFPQARVEIMRDAFRFPTAQSALRYYATAIVDAIDHPPADASHRAPLLAAMAQRLDAIIQSEGIFRVSKDVGCFVAE